MRDKYRWNISAMYPDENKWNDDFKSVTEAAENFSRFSGILGKDSATLLAAYRERDALWQTAERVYVYARMKRDEDNRDTKYQAMSDKCRTLLARVSSITSFFSPELLEIPEETLKSFIAGEEGLKTYEFAILDSLRLKKHVLTKPEEKIIAQYSEITGATNDIFTMFNNADIKFNDIIGEDGKETELTHGKYIVFLESHDRRVRKEAFESMYDAYKKQINSIASMYNYNTKTDIVMASIRKYDSYLHAALAGDNISISVYDNLVNTVNEKLNSLHKYMGLRKKALKTDELHIYDVYVPLVKLPKKEIPYDEAVKMVVAGLAPLGGDYTSKMSAGLAEGWVDVYERKGKTSGAYSFGSYDSMPYILMNYTNSLKDVFTLAHELGHSMHSKYSRESQPYLYGGHSIFTAEVASTVNEALLMEYLAGAEKDPEVKKYLLNMRIEEFRTTVFRQTMFAEFERLTHQLIHEGESLTPELLCGEYEKLNRKYFGDEMVIDDEIRYEWARIPHFYNAFYVYKYATGFSAATAIAEKIIKGGEKEQSDYIKFLRSGESDHPIELLKITGIDMSKPEPLTLAMKTFGNLVDEFEKLM